jgi:hypothetical protein
VRDSPVALAKNDVASDVATVIDAQIRVVRGLRVMLSADLARLYGVETRVLMQAVRRNQQRFPADFMFELTRAEAQAVREAAASGARSRSQNVILDDASGASRRGANIKYLPFAFTEQGVAMLSSVLRSDRAVLVNIEIMRTFVKLRAMLESNKELALKLADLEARYDAQFRDVFDAIRDLTMPPPEPEPSTRRIGFVQD